jgi:hypothetical protein
MLAAFVVALGLGFFLFDLVRVAEFDAPGLETFVRIAIASTAKALTIGLTFGVIRDFLRPEDPTKPLLLLAPPMADQSAEADLQRSSNATAS